MSAVQTLKGGLTKTMASSLLAAWIVVGAVACGQEAGTSSPNAEGKVPVTYAMSWVPTFTQAYFYAAESAGYYDDEGLDVDFVIPESTQTATKLVSIGRAQFGELLGTDPIVAVDKGLPIKVVATWSPSVEIGLITLPGQIGAIDQLEGETVGIFASLAYDDVCRGRLLEAHGLSEDDIEVVDTKFTAVPPLLAGKVAATEGNGAIERVFAEVERDGERVNFFTYGDVCPLFPQEVVVDTEWAEANPEATRGFVAATLRGIKLLTEDPFEARRLFLERFPEVKEPEEMVEANVPTFCGSEASTKGVGYNDHQQYEELIHVMEEAGAVENQLTVDDVVTDEYLPDEPVMTSGCP